MHSLGMQDAKKKYKVLNNYVNQIAYKILVDITKRTELNILNIKYE